jgi:ABC-2 type transport system permease protein
MRKPAFLRRLLALCRKETFQILRDPSSNIIAFVLPPVMLFIFGYGINLDSAALRVGLLLQDPAPEARQFAASLQGSPYLNIVEHRTERELADAITADKIRGYVIVPPDFSRQLKRPGEAVSIQLVTDGSEPSLANTLENYVQGAMQIWQQQRASDIGEPAASQVDLEARFWMNPSAQSRNYLIPGSIVVIMTVIGALLTSLVVAREWERGTMEALLASPVTRTELLLSKLIPYYVLGIVSLLICVGFGVFVMNVPFRGSLLVLLLVGSLFLLSALGMGLLISTVTRNQFNAAQTALNAGFLPALMLSGFVYELQSTPMWVQAFSHLIPARYFVASVQTLFQAGNIWAVLGPNMLFLLGAATLFIGLTAAKTRRTLD